MLQVDHREYVAAGAAAGVAAVFGAPISGILFSVEQVRAMGHGPWAMPRHGSHALNVPRQLHLHSPKPRAR